MNCTLREVRGVLLETERSALRRESQMETEDYLHETLWSVSSHAPSVLSVEGQK